MINVVVVLENILNFGKEMRTSPVESLDSLPPIVWNDNNLPNSRTPTPIESLGDGNCNKVDRQESDKVPNNTPERGAEDTDHRNVVLPTIDSVECTPVAMWSPESGGSGMGGGR